MSITRLRLNLWLRVAVVCLSYLLPSTLLVYFCPISFSSVYPVFVFLPVAVSLMTFVNPWVVRWRCGARAIDLTDEKQAGLQAMLDNLAAVAKMRRAPRLFITPTSTLDARMSGVGGRHGVIFLDRAYLRPASPAGETEATIGHELGHLLTDYTLLVLTLAVFRAVFSLICTCAVASLFAEADAIAIAAIALTAFFSFRLTRLSALYVHRQAEEAADIISVILTGHDALADSLARSLFFDEQGNPHELLGDRDFRTIPVCEPYDDMSGLWGKWRRLWYRMNSEYPSHSARVSTVRAAASSLAPHS